MGKWYRVRVRVRNRARAREQSSSFCLFFFFFSFLFFFFMPKFAYVVTICNFEFCYKRRAIAPKLLYVAKGLKYRWYHDDDVCDLAR